MNKEAFLSGYLSKLTAPYDAEKAATPTSKELGDAAKPVTNEDLLDAYIQRGTRTRQFVTGKGNPSPGLLAAAPAAGQRTNRSKRQEITWRRKT